MKALYNFTDGLESHKGQLTQFFVRGLDGLVIVLTSSLKIVDISASALLLGAFVSVSVFVLSVFNMRLGLSLARHCCGGWKLRLLRL